VLPDSLSFQIDGTLSLTSDVGHCDKNDAAWDVKLSDGPKILNFKERAKLNNFSVLQ